MSNVNLISWAGEPAFPPPADRIAPDPHVQGRLKRLRAGDGRGRRLGLRVAGAVAGALSAVGNAVADGRGNGHLRGHPHPSPECARAAGPRPPLARRRKPPRPAGGADRSRGGAVRAVAAGGGGPRPPAALPAYRRGDDAAGGAPREAPGRNRTTESRGGMTGLSERRIHVVGAGPVGLMLTALLQSMEGVSVHLYEKRREYTRTRMVRLASYLVADSVEGYRADHFDADNVAAVFDPPELAEGLAFRQSIPPDLMGLLRRWTQGFSPLNEIERSVSDLIDARDSNPVQRT